MSKLLHRSNASSSIAGRQIWSRAVTIHAGVRTHHAKGSGVALDENHVLTAAHVIEDNGEGNMFVFHPAQHKAARVFEVAASWGVEDIALLRLARTLPVEPVMIGSSLKLNQPVRSFDIVDLNVENKRLKGGRIISHGIHTQQGYAGEPSGHAQFEMAARSGNSGSGIFNENGELVSMLYAMGRKDNLEPIAIGVPHDVLKAFLNHVAPQLVGT